MIRLNKISASIAANKLRQRMNVPKAWKIVVWENIGWHFRLSHKPSDGLLTLAQSQITGRFQAMLSLSTPGAGDYRWHDPKGFNDPNLAVRTVVKAATRRIKLESALIEIANQQIYDSRKTKNR